MLGEQPVITQWLESRRALGQDGHDEVWEGVYHVAPHEHTRNSVIGLRITMALATRAEELGLTGVGPFNLGAGKTDFRVPDGGWLREDAPLELYMPTAVAVLEVLSPEDETYEKLSFYDERGVREVLIAHPVEQRIECWSREGTGHHVSQDRSRIFDLTMAELAALIRWP